MAGRRLLEAPERNPLKLRAAMTLGLIVLLLALFVGWRAISPSRADVIAFTSGAPDETEAANAPTSSESSSSISPHGLVGGEDEHGMSESVEASNGEKQPSSNGPADANPTAQVTVHVTGAVTNPGVFSLDQSARVDDAIHAAGGFTSEADESALNRAAPLSDGQQVYVPREGEFPREIINNPPAGIANPPGTPSEPTENQRINVNAANANELEALPGIGPVLAREIVSYRDKHGPFSSIEDLAKVSGIGPATLNRLREHVTIG